MNDKPSFTTVSISTLFYYDNYPQNKNVLTWWLVLLSVATVATHYFLAGSTKKNKLYSVFVLLEVSTYLLHSKFNTCKYIQLHWLLVWSKIQFKVSTDKIFYHKITSSLLQCMLHLLTQDLTVPHCRNCLVLIKSRLLYLTWELKNC